MTKSSQNDDDISVFKLADQSPESRHAETEGNVIGTSRDQSASIRVTGDPSGVENYQDGSRAKELLVAPLKLGRYELVRELGAGAMGTVYLAKDSLLARVVALKVPKFSNAGGHELLIKRFYREARAVARLTHPHICPVYDVGEAAGTHFLAMGFIDGEPMDKTVGGGRFMESSAAAFLARQIAIALQHAHDQNVIHRDLKPANIMITKDGTPRIMDFGLARLQDENEPGVTRDGQILGSPAYMSPEQIRGKDIDHRTDIFSLGVILYEMLTGKRPFGGNLTQVLTGIATGVFDSPLNVRNTVAPEINAICVKMMANVRANRYQAMSEVAAALERFLQPAEKSIVKSAPRLSSGAASSESDARRPPKKSSDSQPSNAQASENLGLSEHQAGHSGKHRSPSGKPQSRSARSQEASRHSSAIESVINQALDLAVGTTSGSAPAATPITSGGIAAIKWLASPKVLLSVAGGVIVSTCLGLWLFSGRAETPSYRHNFEDDSQGSNDTNSSSAATGADSDSAPAIRRETHQETFSLDSLEKQE